MTIDKNAGFTVTDSSSDSYSVKCVKAKNKKLPLGRNVTSRKKEGIQPMDAFSSYQ
ncbi:hypothetical protein [Phocaeicola massiliensis]|jgi:hypothetical protein|uniref:hypothetical protein n=1 Tax=Phocaeicola massiliensis TaxID=204516 RepID=UPI0013145931|nr:hypothetical protein [Phocaeicola massiliensis]